MAVDDLDDDEVPRLAGDTLAILKEFYAERDVQQQRFEAMKADTEDTTKILSMEMFAEDWNASQFWYTEATSSTLARQLLKNLTSSSAIAVISAPSTYVQVHNMLLNMDASQKPAMVKLFEFDDRFNVLKDFVHYDYNQPLNLPSELKGKFDRVILDPPFLSEECQTKAAMTARWLLDPLAVKGAVHQTVVCTGERMGDLVPKIHPGCRITTFRPDNGRLSNEFACFANFECDDWSWRSK